MTMLLRAVELLLHACEAYGSRPKSFIEHWPNVSTSKYRHRLRSLDNHHCTLPGNFRLGSFSHYGATGPPYWVFAYPLAPWLSNHTVGMVRHDLPKFRRVTPRHADPLATPLAPRHASPTRAPDHHAASSLPPLLQMAAGRWA